MLSRKRESVFIRGIVVLKFAFVYDGYTLKLNKCITFLILLKNIFLHIKNSMLNKK